MKKIIFILALFVSFLANAQYTPPPGYTNINSRYDWLAGVFRALGLPAGGNAAFTAGQVQRAGSPYYDSTGVDAGLYIWDGSAWVGVQYTDADARSAISLTTTGTSGAATYTSATGVFNIPVYAGTLNTNVGAFYRWLKPDAQEIKTFAAGYGVLIDSTTNTDALTLDVDSLVIANRDWVMDRIADIAPNLLFDSLGAAGISPITTWNNTLYGRRISVSGGSIDTTASGGLLITVTAGGGGDVTKVGTPVNDQLGVWTGDGTIEGPVSLTHTSDVLHVWNGGGGLVVGGDLSATTRTNVTNKFGALAIPHYTNSEEPFALMRGSSTSTSSIVNIGAGLNPGLNSATSVDIYSAATNTSLTAVRRATFTPTKIQFNDGGADYDFQVTADTDANALYVDGSADAVGIGTATPTGWLHIKAGIATQPPFKFTSGTNLTTAEAGSMEFDGTHFYLSPSTTRKKIPLVDNSTASNGFLPIGNGADFTLAAITEGQNINVTNGAGSITVAGPTLTKNATIENPTAAENMGWFRTPVAITITNTHAVLVGGTPSVTYQISFGTDITSLTNVYSAGQTVTSETTGDAASGVNDATIPANSWVRITTSAATDVTQISLSITYTED